MKSYYIICRIFLLLIVLCLSRHGHAQKRDFILPVSESEIRDNAALSAFEKRVKGNPNISKRTYVKLRKIYEVIQEDVVRFSIPGRQDIVAVKTFSMKHTGPKDYEWVGKTEDGRGLVIVVDNNNLMDVHISTPEGVYEIVPASGSVYALHEMDMKVVGDVGCVTSEGTDQKERISRMSELRADKDSVVRSAAREESCGTQTSPRVLILYGEKALMYAGGTAEVYNRAVSAVAQFNSAISNSGINSQAMLILAGVVFPPQPFPEGPEMKDTKNNLASDSNINTLRNNYNADIVVYLSALPPDEWGNFPPRGIAGYTNEPKVDSAYAVVQFYAAVANKTFAHEVGHLFGCRHDGHNATPNYARGFNIKNFLGITVDRTLMSTTSSSSNEGADRLVNFSNPDISVSGRATGDSQHDNARRIDETWSTVAGFRSNPPNAPSAEIEGPSYVTSPGPRTYELVHRCFIGPYSFRWQMSTDGVNYTNLSSTTDSHTHYFHNVSQTVYFRCDISPYGYYGHYTVTAEMGDGPISRVGYTHDPNADDPLQDESPEDLVLGSVFPNPSPGLVHIPFTLPEESLVSLTIVDLNGRVIEVLADKRHFKKSGTYSLDWQAESFPEGNYRYVLEINRKVKSGLILINR